MEAEAFIALGGNVGDVRSTFDQAVALLCDGRAIRLRARSSDYRTAPWGVTDQPPFINAVIEVATDLEPHALLSRTQDSERALGRDMLLYGDRVINDERLTLPHPRMLERAFVLVPLAEIAPDRFIGGIRV